MPVAEARKTFVLDTNVILHDSSCLTQFKRHGIIIPITVLEELDQFKKGNQSINYHAREFLRSLDGLGGETIFEQGVPIGRGHGTVRIVLERELHPDLAFSFSRSKPDDLILNCAYILAQEKKRARVVLVSKDVNLRLKAKAVGLMSDDYLTDHVKDVSTLYTGKREITNLDASVIDTLYAGGTVTPEHLALGTPLIANESLILRNHQKSALARFNPAEGLVRRVNKAPVFGISPRNAEQTFALHAVLNPDVLLVTLSGAAGTGKTLLALAGAMEQRRHFRQIYLARPIVPLSNRDIGFLPGDVLSKINPFMQPLWDNLGIIKNQFDEKEREYKKVDELVETEKLHIVPLAYIRGRSLANVIFIVDEAQNLTPHEVKTIITRAGERTKIVLTGDIFQIDTPYLDAHSNGLSYLIDRLRGNPLYAHINLEKGERSALANLASTML